MDREPFDVKSPLRPPHNLQQPALGERGFEVVVDNRANWPAGIQSTISETGMDRWSSVRDGWLIDGIGMGR
ncbi:hypothetical protein TWF481_005346 [Arthrobotrys musiformis]|uniref:Uncharacterized protein n=1 Tax=Arthrobotrys musiformis TaxID=47236 RepID=A0AAV9WDM4_9PEZI